MRVKAYLFALSFCCMLPFMAQGADLDDQKPPLFGRGCTSTALSLQAKPAIIISTEAGASTERGLFPFEGIGVYFSFNS